MEPIKLQVGSIIKSFVGYFFANSKEWQEDTKPIKYVVAKNGLFEIRDTEFLMAIAKPTEVKGMDVSMNEGIVMKTPKIPYQLYYTALKFLRAVFARDKTEATIHWFWDREKKEYFLWVPKQSNAAAASNYERDKDEEFTKMCEQHCWVMTAHSHPDFGGNFSGIDDADEKDTRIFMVVGHINKNPQDIAIRTMVNGKPITLGFYDIFTSPIDDIGEIPQEWLDRCTKRVYTPAVTTYGGKGYNSPYYAQAAYYQNPRGAWGDYDDYGGGTDPDEYRDLDKRAVGNQYALGPIGSDEIPPEDIGDLVSDNPHIVNAALARQGAGLRGKHMKHGKGAKYSGKYPKGSNR